MTCSALWFEVNCVLVSKDVYKDIYRERGELLFSFLGKCISQLLFLRTGIVEALTINLCTEQFFSCLFCSFYFPAFVSDERLIIIISFNASSCCSISFHARISEDAQIELFVLSSLTTFPRYSLLLVGIKQILQLYRRWKQGFYPSCHSHSFILHLDLLSRQNTQRAGHVRVLLVCHLPFLLEGCPMPCLSFILPPPSLVILLRKFRSGFQEDSKFTTI